MSLRPRQWFKNLLLATPLFFGLVEFNAVWVELFFLGFVSLSSVASAGYLINDLVDFELDGLHPEKRMRPIASGDLHRRIVFLVISLFYLFGLLIAYVTEFNFFYCLLFYIFLVNLYSFVLKRWIYIDLVCLALFYTLRVICGFYLFEVQHSSWVLCFSLFTFFSLGCVKRLSEISLLKKGMLKPQGCIYGENQEKELIYLGLFAGVISVTILTLYLLMGSDVSPVTNLALIFVDLFFSFWMYRMWSLSLKGQLRSDLMGFVIRDKFSLLMGFICLGLFVFL
ncbi:MAG: UbiA prenyltransferase family protein [Bdellovibrionales bacterium]|nr:UbiA prenyltransferase family protein [Bdellovibrionales bacterium]